MCGSRDLVGQYCRVGLAGFDQVAAVAMLGFVRLTGVSGYFLIGATWDRNRTQRHECSDEDPFDAVLVHKPRGAEARRHPEQPGGIQPTGELPAPAPV